MAVVIYTLIKVIQPSGPNDLDVLYVPYGAAIMAVPLLGIATGLACGAVYESNAVKAFAFLIAALTSYVAIGRGDEPCYGIVTQTCYGVPTPVVVMLVLAMWAMNLIAMAAQSIRRDRLSAEQRRVQR